MKIAVGWLVGSVELSEDWSVSERRGIRSTCRLCFVFYVVDLKPNIQPRVVRGQKR